MTVEVIYIVRHGYRMNWTVDPSTGEYKTSTPTPTGIPSDPELASYGLDQARQLAERLVTLQPELDVIYSSPFYRCLQTLKPTIDRLIQNEKIVKSVRVDNGVGEFYGKARFDHPSPASIATLQEHFDFLNPTHKPTIIPSTTGETMEELHDRNAYALHRIISEVDAEPGNPKSIIICTHAASMICMGRALTGRMPEDPNEEDFRCGTCALSKYVRRAPTNGSSDETKVEKWSPDMGERIPFIGWKNDKGVKGGWDCVWNGDCSFLEGGEERTWDFSMEVQHQKTATSENSMGMDVREAGEAVIRIPGSPGTPLAPVPANIPSVSSQGRFPTSQTQPVSTDGDSADDHKVTQVTVNDEFSEDIWPHEPASAA